MDKFSFFFAFYGLILGLAATELLSGFAGFVRARALRRLEPQTAMLALFTFLAICATWLDAWESLRRVTLDFAGLAAPILVATNYYLAATVVFPKEAADYDRMADYYAERKRFVVVVLLANEFLVNWTFWPVFQANLEHHPMVFWLYSVPYNTAIKAALLALLLVRGRRANLAIMAALILLFVLPYWENGAVSAAIIRRFG